MLGADSPVGCLGREEGARSGWPSWSAPVLGRHGASCAGVTSRACRGEELLGSGALPHHGQGEGQKADVMLLT